MNRKEFLKDLSLVAGAFLIPTRLFAFRDGRRIPIPFGTGQVTAAAGTTFKNSTGAGGHGTNCTISTTTATNDTATLTTSQSIAQLDSTKTSGKWYMEYKVNLSPNTGKVFWAVGCSNVDDVGNGQYGTHSWEYAWGIDGNNGGALLVGKYVAGVFTSYGPTPANGDILMVAVDITNLKIYYGLNGTWMVGSDPSTSTSPASSISGTTFWFGCGMGIYSGGSNSFVVQATLNYSVPTGYTQL